MAKMTESDIEVMAIEHLQGLGYEYVYGPTLNPVESIRYVAISRLSLKIKCVQHCNELTRTLVSRSVKKL